jgi:hypothetical protein
MIKTTRCWRVLEERNGLWYRVSVAHYEEEGEQLYFGRRLRAWEED